MKQYIKTVAFILLCYGLELTSALSSEIISACKELNTDQTSASCSTSCTLSPDENTATFDAICNAPDNLTDEKRGF